MTTEKPTDDLNLLLQTGDPGEQNRIVKAGVGSLLVHLLAFVVISTTRILEAPPPRPVRPELEARKVIPLIAPVLEPTQTDPNKGKINRNFDVDSLQPRELSEAAKPAKAMQLPPRPAVDLKPPLPQAPPPRVLEPPKIEIAQTEMVPKVAPGLGTPNAPPPPPPVAEKPKLAFETPGASTAGTGTGARIARPDTSLAEAVRAASQTGRAGGMSVGDSADTLNGGSLSKRPIPGKTATNLELLSDPEGVDMRPYLIKVLTAVRRNWQAVIPESVRLGRRGRVVIQFAIDREGGVPKLVIASPSGAEPLDRAAVAGVSASNPFPPLPSEFKGGQIRLQFTFSYNMSN